MSTKTEAIACAPQISSKGLLRVSWNAAHIAVKATRVCVEMDFVFWTAASETTKSAKLVVSDH